MKFIYKIGWLITYFIFINTSSAETCAPSCQLSLINSYFTALDKISRKGSSIGDIDSLLALTHVSVKYIHVEYEANFTQEEWREAFMRNLQRGAYQNSDKNEIRILNSIAGKNHMAIEYSHGEIQADGSWQQIKPLLVVFGFTEDKISLVKELW